MGHWNHRVVRRTITTFGKPTDWFGIHECFYRLPDESDPGWTEDAVAVEGESVDELRETLERMLLALDKPVLYGTKP